MVRRSVESWWNSLYNHETCRSVQSQSIPAWVSCLQAAAATAIATLSESEGAIQQTVIAEGGLVLLVALLHSGMPGPGGPKAASAHALSSLLAENKGYQVRAVRLNVIKPLLSMLQLGEGEEVTHAANVLSVLSAQDDNNRTLIGEAGGCIALTALLGANVESRGAVALALGHVVTHHEANARAALKLGALKSLSRALRSGAWYARSCSARAIGCFATNRAAWTDKDEGGPAFLQLLPSVLELVRVGPEECQADALLSLEQLSRLSSEVRSTLVARGLLLLLSKIIHGTSVICRQRAADLISVLSQDHRSQCGQHGIIEALVSLLRRAATHESTPIVNALRVLAIGSKENKKLLASAEALLGLVEVLKLGTAQAIEHAAVLILEILSMGTLGSQKAVTASLVSAGAFQALLQCLHQSMVHGHGTITRLLFALITNHREQRPLLAASGAAELLVRLSEQGDDAARERVVCVSRCLPLVTSPAVRMTVATLPRALHAQPHPVASSLLISIAIAAMR